MSSLETTLRNFARKTGLAGLILRTLDRGNARRRAALNREFEQKRPTDVSLNVLGRTVRLKVTNAEEYAHYLAEPENHIMSVVFDNVAQGDVVWDVGANIGLYTLLIGQAVGPKGTVLGFEPMPPCLQRLRENIELNHASHVRPVGVALGRKRERLYMIIGSGGLEGDIRVVREAPPGAPVVDVMPGDEYLREHAQAIPKLIKIDVQGEEENVLLGLETTLRDPACRVIICEMHYAIFAANKNDDAPSRIMQHLNACGFSTIKRLDRNHIGAWKP